MADTSFDRIARTLAQRRTRRAALRALAGAVLGGAAAAPATARADHKPTHCAKQGQQAHPHKHCCAGLIEDANGRCVPDPCAGVDCSHLDTTCSVGVCQDGACTADPINTGASCEDGSACVNDQTCQPDGTCGGGTPIACEEPGICQVSPGICDEGTGDCVYSSAANGTSCACDHRNTSQCECVDGECPCRESNTPCDIWDPGACCSACCKTDGAGGFICC